MHFKLDNGREAVTGAMENTALIRHWVARIMAYSSAWRAGWCRHEQRFENEDILDGNETPTELFDLDEYRLKENLAKTRRKRRHPSGRRIRPPERGGGDAADDVVEWLTEHQP